MQTKPLAALLLALLASAPALCAAPIEQAHRDYYNGHFARSLALYQRLAADGNAEAAERAGFMLAQGGALYGRQVTQDLSQAVALLTRAAKAGRSGAGFMLNMIERTD
jgi:TPR repeat protein